GAGRADHALDPGRGDGGSGAGPAPEGGHVITALLRLLTARAERAAAGVDDRRVDGADVLDVDAELLAMAGQEAGQEDVGAPGEFVEHFAAFGHGHVQPDAALAAVGVVEVGIRITLDAK